MQGGALFVRSLFGEEMADGVVLLRVRESVGVDRVDLAVAFWFHSLDVCA